MPHPAGPENSTTAEALANRAPDRTHAAHVAHDAHADEAPAGLPRVNLPYSQLQACFHHGSTHAPRPSSHVPKSTFNVTCHGAAPE